MSVSYCLWAILVGREDERRVAKRFLSAEGRSLERGGTCRLEQVSWLEICNSLVPQEGSETQFSSQNQPHLCGYLAILFHPVAGITDGWLPVAVTAG